MVGRALKIVKASLMVACLASPLLGQGSGIALSTGAHDASLPVEITADSLTVQQSTNSAEFLGNARVAQGDLRFGADKITVFYDTEGQAVSQIQANGNVVFTNGAESAEARNATYTVASGAIILSGDVLLLQGPNAISGDQLRLDLTSSRAFVSGNVKTVLVPNQ